MKEVLILIPAYNEEKNIDKVLNGIYNSGTLDFADVLVIDDASLDKTARIVKDYGFTCISQIYNMGYGASLQTGYKYATLKGYEFIIQIDADGQHDIENIKKIYDTLKSEQKDGKTPDIVIGSRFLNQKHFYPISMIKRFAIYFLRWAIKRTTKVKITDPTSGLQGLNKRAYQNYAEYGNFDIKYPDANMIIQMLMRGYRVVEIPAKMHIREDGISMHSGLKPLLYGILMPISVITVILREKKRQRKKGR